MKFIYPAVFEREDEFYNVSFPDIPGCFTCGHGLLEAYEMAKDAMELMICDYFSPESSHEAPLPSFPESIKVPAGGFVSLVYSDFDPIRLEEESRVSDSELDNERGSEWFEISSGTASAILEYCEIDRPKEAENAQKD